MNLAEKYRPTSLDDVVGQPIEAYIKLMQRPDVKNNLRAALSLVESGAMLVKGGA